MTTNTALFEKREELKRRLAAGEYKTLVDVFLAGTNRLIGKITRRSKPLPIWLITVILGLVLTISSSAAIYAADGLTTARNVYEELGLGYGLGILWSISLNVWAISAVIVINHCISRISVLWRNDVLDATGSIASLEEFEDWLERACNKRLHLLVTIIGGILLSLYWISITFVRNTSIGSGSIFGTIIFFTFGSAFLYLFLMVILLSARLRRYDLKLFAADPSSSELVSRLSGELGFVVYFVAFYGVFGALLTGLVARFIDPSVGIAQVLFVWLPLIAMFVLDQTSLSSIIRRAKWKTLNEIQTKVEKLQTSKNFGNQETMDSIKRLMDYHDRVKATRDSALDFRTYLSFINSLLLPLLAFLLGNLDLVLNLFARKP